MIESDVARLLHQHFGGEVFFTHVPAEPVPQRGRMVRRIIDVLTVAPDSMTTAVEIKVRRQDFLADIRVPEKQEPWQRVADRHYFAAPVGVIAPEEVPVASGLLLVETVQTASGPGQVVRVSKPAPEAATGPKGIPAWLDHELRRTSSHLLAVLQGWTTSGDDVVDLQAALARAHRDLEDQTRLADRSRERAEAWQMLAAAQGHKVPCSTCGAAITPTRISAGVPAGWRHAQPHLTATCSATTRGVRPREDTP